MIISASIVGHFTVECLVAWPLNEREAGVDLVSTEASLPYVNDAFRFSRVNQYEFT